MDSSIMTNKELQDQTFDTRSHDVFKNYGCTRETKNQETNPKSNQFGLRFVDTNLCIESKQNHVQFLQFKPKDRG